jgi:hypothetical protein
MENETDTRLPCTNLEHAGKGSKYCADCEKKRIKSQKKKKMADTQVFGRNHAMKEILGNSKPNDFKRLTERLTDFHCEICATQLSSDQRKHLIKLCNELIFRLNKEIMSDDTSS